MSFIYPGKVGAAKAEGVDEKRQGDEWDGVIRCEIHTQSRINEKLNLEKK